MHRLSGRARHDEGFTLIELLVVVIIIGILAAIAIPVFLNQREKAWNSAAHSDLRNLITAEETYFTDKGSYTTDGAALRAEQKGLTGRVVHAACIADDEPLQYLLGTKHESGTRIYFYDNFAGAIEDFPVLPDDSLIDSWPGTACTPTSTF